MTEILPPAKNPCGSCPYRCDIEPGIWAASEYDKLPGFDDPHTSLQVFLCHQQNGRLCAGWVGVHDMDNMLGIRIVALQQMLSPEAMSAVLNYATEVPLFASGAEAAEHGRSGIQDPSEKARKVVHKLLAQDKPHPRTIESPTEESP